MRGAACRPLFRDITPRCRVYLLSPLLSVDIMLLLTAAYATDTYAFHADMPCR